MDKNARSMIEDLNRKIESLQQKRDAVIRKEKEKKAKAQEKWKSTLLKDLMKEIIKAYGDSFEEKILPGELAKTMCRHLDYDQAEVTAASVEETKIIASETMEKDAATSGSYQIGGEDE